MDNFLAVSAIGTNRPGLIEPLLRTILDCGCNVADSRMTVLGDQFSMMLLLSGSWNAIAKIENSLTRLENELDIRTMSERTKIAPREGLFMPYAIEVVSADQVGVVHSIAAFFAERNIALEDLVSGTYKASHTETPMFQLHLTISIPTDLSIASLRGDFMEFCDQLNLDAIMEPVK